MIEKVDEYRRKMLNECYMFRYKDEFLVNLSFMPIKKQFSFSRVIYDWDKVINIPVIILDTKNHNGYRFFITYAGKKSGNVIVDVRYKNRNRTIKYESLIRGHYKYLIDGNLGYLYDIGYGWRVVEHIRNKRGRKRYLLKDLTVNDNRYLEIDENKLRARGFPRQKKKLKDLELFNKIVDDKYLDYYAGSNKLIECVCGNCEKIISTKASSVVKRMVCCKDCTKAISFPERVMMAVLDYNNIEYNTEVRIKELGLMRIDFVVEINEHQELFEINGLQHYTKGHRWYNHSVIADNAKRKYAEKHNIPIYFVEAKKSDVDYILSSIEKLNI